MGRYFSIRIESHAFGVLAEYFTGGFNFFNDPLAHQQLPSNATHHDRDFFVSIRGFDRRFRGGCRPFDEMFEISTHELSIEPLGNVAGEDHALVLFIDSNDLRWSQEIGQVAKVYSTG